MLTKIAQSTISTSVERDSFVRGFFHFLEEKGIRAASLHGGTAGFKEELSDVDLVVERTAYGRLPELINGYCESTGWRLCQILRHETTAAFFVCSAMDDPSSVVALDACSDYQRNGTLFLTAEELLSSREPLPWGGHGLPAAVELRYRFAKAAAKGKDPDFCATEFSRYPEEARARCAAWLMDTWRIDPGAWDVRDLTVALDVLRKQSNARPTMLHPGALARILGRIVNPTGLVVVTGEDDYETVADRLGEVFGHLYFRNVRKAAPWRSSMWKDLVTSTLILVPRLPDHWKAILPTRCLHVLDPAMTPSAQHGALAKALAERCAQRERLAGS